MKHFDIGGWSLALDKVSAIGPARKAPPHSDPEQTIHIVSDFFEVVVDTQRIQLYGWTPGDRDRFIAAWQQ